MGETQQRRGRGKGGDVDLRSRCKVDRHRANSCSQVMPTPVYLFSLQSLATFAVGEAAGTRYSLPSYWPHSSDLKT